MNTDISSIYYSVTGKFEDIDTYNTIDISQEGIFSNIYRAIMLIIRKVAEFIKKYYYKIFTHARRYKIQLSVLRNKFVKYIKRLNDESKFGNATCDNLLSKDDCYSYINGCADLLTKANATYKTLANALNMLKGTVKLSKEKIENMIKPIMDYTKTFHLDIDEKYDDIAGDSFTYNELVFNKKKLVEDINQKQNNDTKLSDAGYDSKTVLEIFAKSLFCCDVIIQCKASIEYTGKKLEMTYTSYREKYEDKAFKDNGTNKDDASAVIGITKLLSSLSRTIFSCAYGIIGNVYTQLVIITKAIIFANKNS